MKIMINNFIMYHEGNVCVLLYSCSLVWYVFILKIKNTLNVLYVRVYIMSWTSMKFIVLILHHKNLRPEYNFVGNEWLFKG
jgi:hypothetical protein